MTTLSLLAPAKLNLFLHITGRRPDGYHDLQTLFQLLDYGDQIELRLRKKDAEITLSPGLQGVATVDNLVFKAAKALQQASDCQQGVDIYLKKILPIGGGIGGGSSDAASTLVGLNHLWKTGFSVKRLAHLGKQIGADLPVFIHGETAWAEGIGEKLQAIDIPAKWFVVLAPNCEVSTASIFSHKELTRDTPAITVAAFFEQGGRNDCQQLVRTLYPQVDEALTWLSQYGLAQMTGTGACVFAAFDTEATARKVLAMRPTSLQGFVARGVNQSAIRRFHASS